MRERGGGTWHPDSGVGEGKSQENPGFVPFPFWGFDVKVYIDFTTSIPSSNLEGCWVGKLAWNRDYSQNSSDAGSPNALQVTHKVEEEPRLHATQPMLPAPDPYGRGGALLVPRGEDNSRG